MKSSPIIPGRAYHVSGMGFDIDVIAHHGFDARLIALNWVIAAPRECRTVPVKMRMAK